MNNVLKKAGYILISIFFVSAVSAEEVKIGYVNVMDDAPVHIAEEAGYYAEEGLDSELFRFGSGTDLIKGIVTGNLDIGVLGFTNAITWASRGADLKIIGGAQRGFHAIIARDDRGIDEVGDLSRKSLASQKQGSTADIVLTNVALSGSGLEKRDLTMRYVSPAVAVQSLVAGTVDAAFLFEPYASIARYTAPVTQIYEVGENWPFPCMVVITSAKTLEERPELVAKVLDAQKKAITLLRESPEEAAGHLVKYFIPEGHLDTPKGKVPAETVLKEAIEANTFDWNLSDLDLRRIREIHRIMKDEGMLQQEVDLDRLIDLSWQKG